MRIADSLIDVKSHRRILGDFLLFYALNRYRQEGPVFLKLYRRKTKTSIIISKKCNHDMEYLKY